MKPDRTTDTPAPKIPAFNCACGQSFTTASALIGHAQNCNLQEKK